VFLVPLADLLGQAVELPAVVVLDLCSPLENVVELGDDPLLCFQTVLQAF